MRQNSRARQVSSLLCISVLLSSCGGGGGSLSSDSGTTPPVVVTPPVTTPPTAVDPDGGTQTPPPGTGTPTPEGPPPVVASDSGTRGPGGDSGVRPGTTLPDTGAAEAAAFTVDEGMVSSTFARSSLLAGLLLLVLGSWQLWRRERA